MKKKGHIALIGVYILLVITGVVWHAGGVSAEDTIKLTVNSHSTSTAVMNNMQPGDESSSAYTMVNEGSQAIDYFVDFKFLSGDADLYNILEMTLQKEGVTLYSGVMSKAEGRVAIGSLAGEAEESIQMDVIFPIQAGNEFQGKSVSVTFIFTASAVPQPTAGPSPQPSASPAPSAEASPTPGASASPVPTDGPGSTPEATATPAVTAYPGGIQTPVPSASPSASPSATAGTVEVTVTDPPVPLGGEDGNNGEAVPTPDTGNADNGSTPAPSSDGETAIDDEELPLSGPNGGDELPDTAEPWYNLILISMAVAILSIILLRRLNSKK
ncbi:hypothetical protein R70723_31400 [Paenibacillus sp. FSL R7-0273]|uniref:hypothetical protein n=1 Tax=Paenibacillus sp. FSL R7-0273 TaxID=1536772 RepID=UPI0004F7763E|nr:hypothetical protein [Paenibacillus sp. FSL R7-0273]AIQ49885.1 hypothetical protein R70723_31400 [Paenibacillus sp. FSL R7-0273]OMF85565.1 hypothetical protein BK144_27720 [Paenibacillus sp. FSL R7-0273]